MTSREHGPTCADLLVPLPFTAAYGGVGSCPENLAAASLLPARCWEPFKIRAGAHASQSSAFFTHAEQRAKKLIRLRA